LRTGTRGDSDYRGSSSHRSDGELGRIKRRTMSWDVHYVSPVWVPNRGICRFQASQRNVVTDRQAVPCIPGSDNMGAA
jgi:hypothetical protein